MKPKRAIWHVFVLISVLFASLAQADWLNLTGAETSRNIAEIYILNDEVKVKLEVFPGDLETFRDLVPDSWTKDLDIQRPSLEERQRRFANQTLVIQEEDGKILPAQFMLVETRMRVER